MPCPKLISIEPDSLAQELGLAPGDRICRVNGREVLDLIEFQMEWAGDEAVLEVEKADGQRQVFEIEKDYDEPLGVVFEQAVFDGIRVCRNKCLFCFVDQMPERLRPSLYVKDDDYRLSFLQGSFITLTNLSTEDLERIKRDHLSPLYVSVHTTDPRLRREILKNPRAGELLGVISGLAQAGIEFHTQVVLCPGLNDGPYLVKTFEDLFKQKGILSLAIVPVGLTGFREGLPNLQTFDQAGARQVLEWIHSRQDLCRREKGTAFIWASDEFYLQAGLEFPPWDSYEDFPQLENGVGLVRLFWEELAREKLPARLQPEREMTIATGVSGGRVMEPVIERLKAIKGLTLNLKVLENTFFGPSVTVTGLLTGSCLLEGLADLPEGSTVVIPQVLLESREGRFLDNLTPRQVAEQLKLRILTAPVSARGFLDVIKAG